ncbi:MAG: nitroreductase family deazaflavin-dependent oxidoreductase [Ardenticatenaceae bacterium]|nr:nitroreductase family deazaflavin-dependent oxidoreductase [Anaerolineales bacterium]MCB8923748.1 nitroreductase family deazaflavin-dependent oxidoreductase [Ardenticatenaceae bacterium]MCB8990083.1 nitroreductase family deazaflavin-dependent oxidoreductase [Ardenticatenaceae bacterium]
MSTISPQMEQSLRQGFKYLNKFMVAMWRLGLGKWINAWPEKGGRIMVITHIGRKSGLTRRTPVNYAEVDGDIYCTAGFGRVADWYRNILAHPEVEIWLPDGWCTAVAEDITNCDKHLVYMRDVLIASGFAAHAAGIHPRMMLDDELAAATAVYRLIRIRRTAARTGSGGPGDLAWIWPALTFALLPLALRRRR